MDLEKLRKLVNEMCAACDASSGDKPDAKDSPKQAKMARTDLVTIARDAQELVNMFSDETDLPEWVESKITKAADYLNSVRKYIGGEIIRQQDNLMEAGYYKNPDRDEIDSGIGKKAMGSGGDAHEKMRSKAKTQDQLSKDFLASRPGSKSPRARKMLINKYKKMGLKNIPSFDVNEVSEDDMKGEEEYYHISDATYDDGSPVEEGIEFWDDIVMEAEYKGRKVKLNKPMQGDVKKSKVYVKNAKGNVVKVNFGDKNMKIKKSNPKRRKSFRARHNCKNPGPKTKARYWSCKAW